MTHVHSGTNASAAIGAPVGASSPIDAGAPRRLRLYLTRGLIAIAWAIAFASASDALTTGAAVLIVLYPLIDVVASLIDARGRHDTSAGRLQQINAWLSGLAAAALAIAATGDIEAVLRVFGAWAVVAGAAQVIVAVRRRGPETPAQWPMYVAGGLSVLVGVFYNLADPRLDNLVIYATGGGVWFILQAGILARRRRAIERS